MTEGFDFWWKENFAIQYNQKEVFETDKTCYRNPNRLLPSFKS